MDCVYCTDYRVVTPVYPNVSDLSMPICLDRQLLRHAG